MVVLYALLFVMLAVLVYYGVAARDRRRNVAPLRCRLRGHQRSGRHIHKIEDAYYSRCRVCGVSMEKPSRASAWRAISRVPQPRERDDAVADAEPLAQEAAPTTPIIRRGEPAG